MELSGLARGKIYSKTWVLAKAIEPKDWYIDVLRNQEWMESIISQNSGGIIHVLLYIHN